MAKVEIIKDDDAPFLTLTLTKEEAEVLTRVSGSIIGSGPRCVMDKIYDALIIAGVDCSKINIPIKNMVFRDNSDLEYSTRII